MRELEKKRDKPQVYFEEEKVQQGMVRLRGWAIAKSPVTIRIYDENKEQLAADIQRTDRVDVDQLYDEIKHPEKTGFFTEVTGVSGKCLYVVFYAGDRKTVKVVPLRKLDVLAKKADKYAKKGIRYWKSQGGAALAGKVVSKIRTVSTRRDPIVRSGSPAIFLARQNWRSREGRNSVTARRYPLLYRCTKHRRNICADWWSHSAADIYQLGAVSF